MTDFAKVAKEVFQVLRSFNYTTKMYDDEGTSVTEPEETRRFFATKPRSLMVSVIDDDDDSSIKLFYGKSTDANDVMGLIQTLRQTATKYALSFSAQQYEKEIEPKDLSPLAQIAERRYMINLALIEGMYGTTKSSYLRMENARMIVRHSKRIDDSIIGARGRCVESIFIENASGERLLFPSTQIAPARAMTQHVNQNGTFADQVGEQIMRMTNDYVNLGQAANYISSASNLQEGAMAVREACRSNKKNLRKTFERLSKPSTYAKECTSMVEQASMLSETDAAIDETRINEVKRLLNDADLPHSVYECCCKAMDKMKKEEPITEATKIRPTTNVLGHRVDKEAWEKFKLGELDLTDREFHLPQQFRDYYGELCFKLAMIADVEKDHGLANLFTYISDAIGEFVSTKTRPHRSEEGSSSDWKTTFENMKKIARWAVKAAGIPMENTPQLVAAESITEYMNWLNMFDPDRILMEDWGMDPYSTVSDGYGHHRDSGDAQDDAEGQAISDFDPEDFVEASEITQGKEAENPEENVISHGDLMAALQEYLRNYIEGNSDYYQDGFDGDLTASAKAVYDDACEALQTKGFVVEDKFNTEDADGDDESWEGGLEDLDEFALNPGEDVILSKEDIMIPKDDMGNSLRKDVTKQVVKDVDTDQYRKPDPSYINRLQALGWTTSGGPGGQSY